MKIIQVFPCKIHIPLQSTLGDQKVREYGKTRYCNKAYETCTTYKIYSNLAIENANLFYFTN